MVWVPPPEAGGGEELFSEEPQPASSASAVILTATNPKLKDFFMKSLQLKSLFYSGSCTYNLRSRCMGHGPALFCALAADFRALLTVFVLMLGAFVGAVVTDRSAEFTEFVGHGGTSAHCSRCLPAYPCAILAIACACRPVAIQDTMIAATLTLLGANSTRVDAGLEFLVVHEKSLLGFVPFMNNGNRSRVSSYPVNDYK